MKNFFLILFAVGTLVFASLYFQLLNRTKEPGRTPAPDRPLAAPIAPAVKTIILARETNGLVGASQNVWSLTVWTDAPLLPGERLHARGRLPDGAMQDARSMQFLNWSPDQARTSCSFNWTFKEAFGEAEVQSAIKQLQTGKVGRPLELAAGKPLELFSVTNRFGAVMTGLVEFEQVKPHPENKPPVPGATARALVTIQRVNPVFPGIDYSAKVPPGFALRAIASSGQVSTHTPSGPYEYSSTWFRTPSLPSPATSGTAQNWMADRQAQQSAIAAQIQRLQSGGQVEVVAGKPQLIFSVTNSTGDVFEGFLELIGPPFIASK